MLDAPQSGGNIGMMDFWARMDRLLASHPVVIERPKHSAHPRFPKLEYPLDYGYLEDTSAGDGGEIDVWIGSQEPCALVGIVCTVDSLKGDAEIKLLLGCTEEEVELIRNFHNGSEHMSGIIVKREARP